MQKNIWKLVWNTIEVICHFLSSTQYWGYTSWNKVYLSNCLNLRSQDGAKIPKHIFLTSLKFPWSALSAMWYKSNCSHIGGGMEQCFAVIRIFLEKLINRLLIMFNLGLLWGQTRLKLICLWYFGVFICFVRNFQTRGYMLVIEALF